MKNETFPVPLGCIYKPADDLFRLINAAGLPMSFVRDFGRIFCDSRKDVTLGAFSVLPESNGS